jgi:hypothetical protein
MQFSDHLPPPPNHLSCNQFDESALWNAAECLGFMHHHCAALIEITQEPFLCLSCLIRHMVSVANNQARACLLFLAL